MTRIILFLMTIAVILPATVRAQKKKKNQASESEAISDTLFHGFKWRNIGPFRGGRSVAASGVVKEPMTYYFGSTGGGVWKTIDDGITWKNVSDGFLKTGTVGAIAVSETIKVSVTDASWVPGANRSSVFEN